MPEEPKLLDSKAAAGLTLREFLIDIVACFIPGTIFISLIGLCAYWPIRIAVEAGIKPSAPIPMDLSFVTTPPSYVLLFALAYTIGFILYRSEPKVPDQESFATIKKGHPKADSGLGKTWVAQTISDCEFPYVHLKTYLAHRKRWGLAQMITWEPEDETARSKNFINALKIALEYHHPDRSGVVSRNEAHVRFMASTWYMAYHLMRWSKLLYTLMVGIVVVWAYHAPESIQVNEWITDRANAMSPALHKFVFALALVALALVIGDLSQSGRLLKERKNDLDFVCREPSILLLGSVVLSLLATGIASYYAGALVAWPGFLLTLGSYVSMWRVRVKIDEFLHYQRVREAYFVLDLAAIAFDSEREILRGIVSDDWVEKKDFSAVKSWYTSLHLDDSP